MIAPPGRASMGKSGQTSVDRCFCCGTPSDRILDAPRMRRSWRRRWLFAALLGAVICLGGSIGAKQHLAFLFLFGVGFGFVAMGAILIDKFPRGPYSSQAAERCGDHPAEKG